MEKTIQIRLKETGGLWESTKESMNVILSGMIKG